MRQYIAHRHGQGASNATINRDLITLKRICSLAIQANTLITRPYIPLLQEWNVRTGFLERHELARITAALPRSRRGVAEVCLRDGLADAERGRPARMGRQVDFTAGEVRLDPGTTKNGEGRNFPLTADVRRVLQQQHAVADHLERQRGVRPRAVFCYTAGPRVGQPISAGVHPPVVACARARRVPRSHSA